MKLAFVLLAVVLERTNAFFQLRENATGSSAILPPNTRLNLTQSDLIRSFRRALKRTTIERPKGQAAHVLRHTFASHFIMNGGNILTLQKVLGHSDIKMTMRYSHLSPDFLEEATRLNPLSKN